MSFKTSVFGALVTTALIAVPVVHSADRDAKATLTKSQHRLAVAASRTKGIPRANIDFQRQRVDRLIDALERGERVSPSEIDRELERANRVAY